MKNITVNGVAVQFFKDTNGCYYGGFVFGFGDSRNYCGYFGSSLRAVFKHIRSYTQK